MRSLNSELFLYLKKCNFLSSTYLNSVIAFAQINIICANLYQFQRSNSLLYCVFQIKHLKKRCQCFFQKTAQKRLLGWFETLSKICLIYSKQILKVLICQIKNDLPCGYFDLVNALKCSQPAQFLQHHMWTKWQWEHIGFWKSCIFFPSSKRFIE